MKRTFIAIKIHPEDTIIHFINKSKSLLKDEKIKWVDFNNLHITLAFLGETEDKSIEIIKTILHDITLNSNQITLKFSGFGIFENIYNPKILWIDIEENNSLIRLQQEISNQLRSLNHKPNHQFLPHLTLGRIRHLNDHKILQGILSKYHNYYFQESIVTQITYFESFLMPDGPIYKPIIKLPLNES